ncbi:hypothetical protein C3L33_16882, partial [Rhododendron williamsianum]
MQLNKVIELDVTGGIPEELWSLTSLTKMNLGRNYLTGPLSSSIANLTQMQWLNLGVNALSGEVPKELGKLTNLSQLGIGTNNFSGSLPSELGNLIKLQNLYFDSSGVSGAIPSTFAALQNLQLVWGSDNELTGSIPEFIGNWSKLFDLRISDLSNGSSSLAFLKDMTSLSTLILRNNHISGTIPSNIGDYQSLSQLFLGNNKLNGTPPALKSPSLLHIVLATGFDGCIQRTFPCLGGIPDSPKYSDFAINCGGPERTSSSQIVYDQDNEPLGPATYHEASTKRWAGNLVRKDFDIKKEAGGVTFKAVQIDFHAQVSKNYLEIHLFWAGKGTCCIPTTNTYGPSISAISVVPDFIPTVGKNHTHGKKSKTGLILEIVVPVGVVSFLSFLALYWFVLCQKGPGSDDDEELLRMDVRPYTISYAELKAATEDFNPANKLGEGGFGPVFKAWHVHENNREVELVDARLLEFDEEEVKRVIRVALLCTQTSPQQRPSMPRAVAMLSGDIEVGAPSRPGYLIDWNFDTTTDDLEDGDNDGADDRDGDDDSIDLVQIAPKDRPVPDEGSFVDDHLAGEDDVGSHVGIDGDLGEPLAERDDLAVSSVVPFHSIWQFCDLRGGYCCFGDESATEEVVVVRGERGGV